MFKMFTRSTFLACLLLLTSFLVKANDSDVVNCGRPFKIVLLGSSTTYGTGANPIDSSWAAKFTSYNLRKNSQTLVYNFGIPGYTSYNVLCPTGFVAPANRPAPDPQNNITAALALHPDAIIINLPSNDAAYDYTLKEQQQNFERVKYLADSANVPLWVTTTQPRNNLTSTQMTNLTSMRDWLTARFGVKAVDFWTTVANSDGTINSTYNADGTHVNNLGHDIFYKRILSETILDSLCLRVNGGLIARAGNDASVILPGTGFQLDGSASSGSNPITSYTWTKTDGPAITGFTSAGSAITSLTNLVEGRYTFLLTVTDNAGHTSTDDVNVIVGSRILVDFGSNSTPSPDAGGRFWNNVPVAQQGVQLTNAVTTAGATSAITLTVVNRIDGTFNEGGPGTSSNASGSDVGDYPASATIDYAFSEPSTTNGQWNFTGLEASKQYTFKFWGTRAVEDQRIIQIKRADQTIWQEYNGAGNTDYNNAVSITFSGKTSMAFDIRTKDGSPFGYISIVDISRTTALNVPNIPPVARVSNINVASPATTATLTGETSSDEDGNIASYSWTKLTGPAGGNVSSPTSPNTTITDLQDGVYTYDLLVTDNEGATGHATATVTVGTRILFDFGSVNTAAPDVYGKYWNNVAVAQTGITVDNALNTAGTATTVDFQVVNRIDGTFNVGGPGTSANTSGNDVGDYPSTATIDYAFSEPSTTSGSWKLTGLDSDKRYTVKFWGTRAVDDDRFIQIKLSDSTEWKEYNSSNNNNYNNGASFTFTGKTEQSFDIRTKDGSAFGYISIIDINVTVPPPCVPVTPSVSITASAASVCAGTNVTFTATATNGGTNTTWFWFKNGALIANANTSTYSSNTLVANDLITASITSNVACATTPNAVSNALSIIINQPSSSTATVTACNTYTWNQVAYTNSGTYVKTGLINKAGCDSTATLILTINRIATQPVAITGPTNACPYVVTTANPNGVLATYTINKVANAASYNWTVPANATIVSRPGVAGTANDTIIHVRFANAFASGNISVTASNNCGTSAARTLAITKSIPAAPGTITGTTNACANIAANTVATYTIAKVAGASDYDWTISGTGATIVSHPAGEGVNDTIITVRFTTAFTSGTLSVKSVSNCGNNATARTLTITKTAPATPVTTGGISACSGGTYTYTATSAGATSFVWTLPSGCTFIGSSTGATVTVRYPAFFLLGTINVKAVSACGTSATNSFLVMNCIFGLGNLQLTYRTTDPTPATINNTPKSNTPKALTVNVVDNSGKVATAKTVTAEDSKAAINVYPNPSNGNFTVAVKGNLKSAPVTIEVLNNYGQSIYKTTSADPAIQVRIANKLANGIYFVRSNVNGQIITQKLVVNR
ncbi:PKD domain-containing protein [Ferruginibacter sp. HRS2-29]|uniref:PKD domain-containing protein n=1 Tax=Ferruginibacter sp. HRS2-29 TaxID=2487334 RepID=UPI0020CF127A|nr:PKD domain-containing protein [Ferruginibacter sp. HRS2-29]MCP9751101.1 PKD domain-containing protein [Ferruginibacter sp. HRS2-29]